MLWYLQINDLFNFKNISEILICRCKGSRVKIEKCLKIKLLLLRLDCKLKVARPDVYCLRRVKTYITLTRAGRLPPSIDFRKNCMDVASRFLSFIVSMKTKYTCKSKCTVYILWFIGSQKGKNPKPHQQIWHTKHLL